MDSVLHVLAVLALPTIAVGFVTVVYRGWWLGGGSTPPEVDGLIETFCAPPRPRHDYDSDPEHVANCAKCSVWARLETALECEEMA